VVVCLLPWSFILLLLLALSLPFASWCCGVALDSGNPLPWRRSARLSASFILLCSVIRGVDIQNARVPRLELNHVLREFSVAISNAFRQRNE
jgi:hypothetical protein